DLGAIAHDERARIGGVAHDLVGMIRQLRVVVHLVVAPEIVDRPRIDELRDHDVVHRWGYSAAFLISVSPGRTRVKATGSAVTSIPPSRKPTQVYREVDRSPEAG